jgi:soluble lytic murein transglycosylase-like protein
VAVVLIGLCFNVALAQPDRVKKSSERRAEAEYYVRAYSRHYGLSPELIRALISQESNWNRRALSSKGAMGYMQLMPETAVAYGVVNPFDPSQNIGAGVHYLADLMRQFNGDPRVDPVLTNGPTYPEKQGRVDQSSNRI